jgi:hypothetical protein
MYVLNLGRIGLITVTSARSALHDAFKHVATSTGKGLTLHVSGPVWLRLKIAGHRSFSVPPMQKCVPAALTHSCVGTTRKAEAGPTAVARNVKHIRTRNSTNFDLRNSDKTARVPALTANFGRSAKAILKPLKRSSDHSQLGLAMETPDPISPMLRPS